MRRMAQKKKQVGKGGKTVIRVVREVPLSRKKAAKTLIPYRSAARLSTAATTLFLASGNRFEAPVPPSFHSSECPKCFHIMSEKDIIAGFKDDVVDFTTDCPNCGHSFVTTAVLDVFGENATFPCLCPSQTKDQCDLFFENNQNRTDIEKVVLLATSRPELAWNAYWHGRTKSNEGNEADCVSDVIQFFLFGTVNDVFESSPDFIPVTDNFNIPNVASDEDVFDMEIDPPIPFTTNPIKVEFDVGVKIDDNNYNDKNIQRNDNNDNDNDVHLFDEDEDMLPGFPILASEEEVPIRPVRRVRLNPTPPPSTDLPKVRKTKISRAAVKRIATRSGARRISKRSAFQIQDIAESFLSDLIGSSALVMEHRRGKVLQPKDTTLVTQILRNNRRGFF